MDEPYPKEWGPDDFPHPNPYFPWPRKVDRRLLVVGISALVAFIALLTATIGINRQVPQWVSLAGMVTATLMVPLGLLCLISYKRALGWAHTRILPARVEIAAAGPPPSGAVADVSTSLLGPIGLLAHALPKPVDRDAIVVEYVRHGRVLREKVNTADRWDKLPAGAVIWICPGSWRGRSCLVQWLAPREHRETPVPDEARAWLESAIEEASWRTD